MKNLFLIACSFLLIVNTLFAQEGQGMKKPYDPETRAKIDKAFVKKTQFTVGFDKSLLYGFWLSPIRRAQATSIFGGVTFFEGEVLSLYVGATLFQPARSEKQESRVRFLLPQVQKNQSYVTAFARAEFALFNIFGRSFVKHGRRGNYFEATPALFIQQTVLMGKQAPVFKEEIRRGNSHTVYSTFVGRQNFTTGFLIDLSFKRDLPSGKTIEIFSRFSAEGKPFWAGSHVYQEETVKSVSHGGDEVLRVDTYDRRRGVGVGLVLGAKIKFQKVRNEGGPSYIYCPRY